MLVYLQYRERERGGRGRGVGRGKERGSWVDLAEVNA